jgi:hypothetical protein
MGLDLRWDEIGWMGGVMVYAFMMDVAGLILADGIFI